MKSVGLKSYAVGRRRRPSTYVDEEWDALRHLFSTLLRAREGGHSALRPTA